MSFGFHQFVSRVTRRQGPPRRLRPAGRARTVFALAYLLAVGSILNTLNNIRKIKYDHVTKHEAPEATFVGSSKRQHKFYYWNNTKGINSDIIPSYFDWFMKYGRKQQYSFSNMARVPLIIKKNNRTQLYECAYSITAVRKNPAPHHFKNDRVEPMVQFISTALNKGSKRQYIIAQNKNSGAPNDIQQQEDEDDRKRLFQLLDSGVEIPMILDISDQHPCGNTDLFGPSFRRTENESTTLFPIFAMARPVDCQHVFPLPTFLAMRHARESSQDWQEYFEASNQLYPWEAKLYSAIWRGSNTGSQRPNPYNRKWVEHVGNKFSNGTIDARVVGNKNDKQRVPFEDFQRHRAIIDTDGNGWSGRFLWLLCMNSVVVKLQPQTGVDYNMDTILPWVHYIPANFTVQNLTASVQYAIADENSDTVKRIVQSANEWRRINLTWQKQRNDYLDIFSGYVEELDRGSRIGWEDDWKSLQSNATYQHTMSYQSK